MTAIFVCLPAAGQTAGTIQGWISDSFGAPLPGVTVEATCASLPAHRTTVTVKDGTYRLSSLSPGRCVLRTSRPGFASVEKPVEVAANEIATVPLILQLAARERVLVSGDAPFVDTTTTTSARSYGSSVIIHLPLDRNYADVARDHPGVVTDHGGTQGRAISIALNGSTSAESQWTIDGISTTNVMEGVQGKGFNNEAIEAVEIRTGGFQAEYGRSLGGIINVVTKSGGNAFHGGGFVYYDSSQTRAARVYDEAKDSPLSGMHLADYERTDYGFHLGGYLFRDRLFFFGAFNRTDFPAHVSRVASSEFVLASDKFPLDGVDELYSLKLTWNPAPASTVVGTVFSDPTRNSGAGAADPRRTSAVFRVIDNPDPGTWQSQRDIGATDYGLRIGQVVGSSGFFGIQAARHQDRFELVPIEAGLAVRIGDFTCTGGTPVHACDVPTEENFATGGFGNLGGPGNNSRSHRDQFRMDGNLFAGAHEIKLGGDYQDSWTEAAARLSGGQLVSRFNEFGTTYYRHVFNTDGVHNLTPISGTRQGGLREAGAYVQDSWKAAPGVTINAGLRWDAENVREFSGATVVRLTDEWQPRLGVAWDPWRDGRTNVYAFAGRFYYSVPTNLVLQGFGGVPTSRTFNYSETDVTPAPDIARGGLGEQPVNALLVDDGLHGVSLDEFTIGVERLIGPSLSVGVKASYRTLHNTFEDRCDIDYLAPDNHVDTNCALVNAGSSGKYARGDFYSCTGADSPDFNNCLLPVDDPGRYVYGGPPMPRARRIYKGLEIVARKTIADRLWLQASYVYSTLRGNYDGEVNESLGGQTAPTISRDFDYPYSEKNSSGRLFLDRPVDFRLAGYYRTPVGLSVGLDGYAISGAPLDRWGYFNQNGYMARLVPRGSAGRMPTLWEANLTLEYPFRTGPATVTLQGYVFNLFNNQIPTDEDQIWSHTPPYNPDPPQRNPNFGLATQRQPPRLFRAALRVSF